MANWENTIDVSKLYAGYRDGSIPITGVAHAIADILKEKFGQSYYVNDMYFESIVDDLVDFQPEQDADDFDDIMGRLYDWGDEGHRLWIKTF